jgi:sterol desaturase/sphingolipid hydroxylase (fatty acid hydroxylase superfamily)
MRDRKGGQETPEAVMQQFKSFVDTYLDHGLSVVKFPLDPSNRIYVLYLISSLVIAFAIYISQRRKSEEVEGERSFAGFLFPKKVWSHPSAWLDVRYFFFHQMIGHFLMLGLLGGSAALAYTWTIGDVSASDPSAVQPLEGWHGTAVAFGYMVVLFLVIDFIGFFAHYLQHKIPILWQFHKVHHSACYYLYYNNSHGYHFL